MVDIQTEFIKRVQAQIDMRERTTRTDKERVFAEMMIYEDAIRIMNQVVAYANNVNTGKISISH